jgi:hypothetical protein
VATVLCLSPSQLATQMPSQFLSTQGLNASPGMAERGIISNQTHKSAITMLRLCPSSSSKKEKDLMIKSAMNGSQELLIGDDRGYVSRWTVMTLDQLELSQRDLRGLGLRVPPHREKTPEGVASGGAFPSAGGFLKLLGGGIGGGQALSGHHETASSLAARISEIEDMANDDNTEEFFS